MSHACPGVRLLTCLRLATSRSLDDIETIDGRSAPSRLTASRTVLRRRLNMAFVLVDLNYVDSVDLVTGKVKCYLRHLIQVLVKC